MISGILSLIVAELYLWTFPSMQDALVLHLAWSELPAELYEPLPQSLQPGERPKATSYTHRPNTSGRFKALEYDVTVNTNALGFRGAEPLSEQQVLLLGDSFVFGAQVSLDNTFVAQLNDRHPSLSILNAGVSGYGTYESVHLWKRMKKRIATQQVVLFFFWGNDLRDNQKYADAEAMKEQTPTMLPLFPARYSRLYGRLYLLFSAKDSRLEEKRKQMDILYDSKQRAAALAATHTAFAMFETECVHQGVQCSLVLLPPVEAFIDSTMAEAVILDIMSIVPSEIRTIDLYSGLKLRGGRDLYFRFDPHWNILGHRAVADVLMEKEIFR